jgi:hypothetical protein
MLSSTKHTPHTTITLQNYSTTRHQHTSSHHHTSHDTHHHTSSHHHTLTHIITSSQHNITHQPARTYKQHQCSAALTTQPSHQPNHTQQHNNTTTLQQHHITTSHIITTYHHSPPRTNIHAAPMLSSSAEDFPRPIFCTKE